ncbi:glycoside hydrolase [Aspergillus varians]
MLPTWLSIRALLLPLLSLLTLPQPTQAKAVFAHFMVSNSQNYTLSDWHADITLAKASSIDAFALNAGHGQIYNTASFHNAFAAADELAFKLFFSLDYSGDGGWPKDQVVTLLKNYTTHDAYFRHSDGRALVSTFEGFQAAGDWGEIKEDVAKGSSNHSKEGGGEENKCCFFIPNWTSVGLNRASSVSAIDGLMSWDAWPYGNQEMNTTEDRQYLDILDGRAYIMPVSPWFYTNLRQFDKNWVWQGDDLWYTRWEQVVAVQPEYVEILTWNDYGESHYIGPLREKAVGVMHGAGAPFDYVTGMPHDGWRALLPYWIARYKGGKEDEGGGGVEIEEEVVSVWYRLSAADACGDGKTVGNNEGQKQHLMKPGDVLADRVFYSALLEGGADVMVSIGGENRSVDWTEVPDGGRGVYHGSVPFDDRTGQVVVTLSRDGDFLAQMKGESIKDSCPGNLTNWNAWVGNATAVRTNRVNGGEGNGNGSESAAAISRQMGPVLWVLCLAYFVFCFL